MPRNYRWTKEDHATLSRIQELWPELRIRGGNNNALVHFSTLKGLAKFVKFMHEDDYLSLRTSPYKPGDPRPTVEKWSYTLVEVEHLVFEAVVLIPPKQLKIIKGVLERV